MMIQYGNTANFTDGAQPNGPALSQGVLDYCEYDLARISMMFGGILLPGKIQRMARHHGVTRHFTVA